MPLTEAQKRAKEKYRQKRKSVLLEFFPPEMDLYEHIEKQSAKATYIKHLIKEDIMRQARKPLKRPVDHLLFYKTADAIGQGMIIVYDTTKHKSTFIDSEDVYEGETLISTTAIYMQDSRLFDSLDDIDDDTTPSLDTSDMKDVTKDVIREYNKLFD